MCEFSRCRLNYTSQMENYFSKTFFLPDLKSLKWSLSQSYNLLMREYLHEFKGGLETHFTQSIPSTFLKCIVEGHHSMFSVPFCSKVIIISSFHCNENRVL